MDSRLAELKRAPFSLEPRFYPPGGHPAIQRMKRHAQELELVRSKLVAHGMDTSNCDAALDYALGKIAAFEEGESEAKQRTLWMLERRER